MDERVKISSVVQHARFLVGEYQSKCVRRDSHHWSPAPRPPTHQEHHPLEPAQVGAMRRVGWGTTPHDSRNNHKRLVRCSLSLRQEENFLLPSAITRKYVHGALA